MSDAEWIAATNQERGLIRERDKALKERDKLQAKIDEVLDLHSLTLDVSWEGGIGRLCSHDGYPYPCDTRQAAGVKP